MAETKGTSVRIPADVVAAARLGAPELESLDFGTLARVGLIVLATSGAVLGPVIAEAIARARTKPGPKPGTKLGPRPRGRATA